MTGYPQYVTPPKQLERVLRDLVRGWQEVVFRIPDATDDYRAMTQGVILEVEAALKEGLTPYEVAVLTLSSAFAGPYDERVVVMPLTDEQIDAGQTVLEAWAAKEDE